MLYGFLYKLNNKIIVLKDNKNICTIEYSSLEALYGNTSERKEDIESVFYLLIKKYNKNLPWNILKNFIQKNDYPNEKYNESNKIRQKLLEANQDIIRKIININKYYERLNIEEHIFLREFLLPEEIFFG